MPRVTGLVFDDEACTLISQDTTEMLVGRLTLETDPAIVLSALALADPVMANTPVHDDTLAEQVRGAVVDLGTASDDPRLTRAVLVALGTHGFIPASAFRGSTGLQELFRTSLASPDAALHGAHPAEHGQPGRRRRR